MLRLLLRGIAHNKTVALFVLRIALKAHNFLYDLCGVLAVTVHAGEHPKHHLLRYKEWFLDRIEPDFVVLDVGSNTGAMSSMIGTKAKRVYGIEIDERLSLVAKQKNSAANVEYLTGDATTYDYSACSAIDCVTLSNVIEHIEHRVEFLKMLRDRLPWRRSEHKMFLIRVPTIERDWLSMYKKSIGAEYRLDRTHVIEHTRLEFFAELESSGLEVREFDCRFGEFYAVCFGQLP